jgi:hypothetical protein
MPVSDTVAVVGAGFRVALSAGKPAILWNAITEALEVSLDRMAYTIEGLALVSLTISDTDFP